jgi:hypothetical protein
MRRQSRVSRRSMDLFARLASLPNAGDEDENVVPCGRRGIARNVSVGAKTNDDLADIGVFRGHAETGKVLDPLKRGPDRCERAFRGIGIVALKEGPQSLDVLSGVGRKQDHPILRGCGRGSSSGDPQLATHALTSSRGTAR